ncbi:MAG: ATPase, T2SS/T4P/T4SS family [Bacillota bacterium]
MLKALRKETPLQPLQPKHVSLDEAVELVQNALAQEEDEEQTQVFRAAAGGIPEAIAEAKRRLESIISREMIHVDDEMTSDAIAEEIFRRVWGLDKLQDLYDDPAVDEIRVLDSGRVYVSRRGKNTPVALQLNQHEIERLIKRMIMHDVGVALNESSPRLEAVRLDGSRLTALCRPVARGFCFALRKHGTVEMTVPNLTRLGTLNERVWKALSLLVRGRRNILIIGPVNSGKTSLLRRLIGELPANLSIRILDLDNEIRASEAYPDRDILELEAHPEVGAPMKKLFESILRLSPDVIIVGEFRGVGEALEAIRACIRGHDGSMATAHFTSPAEAVRGTAMLMLEEGLNLSLDMAQAQVARAFNVVVQMFSDSTRGVKKIVSVTEIEESGGEITYRELIRWEPFTADYLGPGKWVFENVPGPAACEKMRRYGVTKEEIREVFRPE